jgi:hypothetical protein
LDGAQEVRDDHSHDVETPSRHQPGRVRLLRERPFILATTVVAADCSRVREARQKPSRRLRHRSRARVAKAALQAVWQRVGVSRGRQSWDARGSRQSRWRVDQVIKGRCRASAGSSLTTRPFCTRRGARKLRRPGIHLYDLREADPPEPSVFCR